MQHDQVIWEIISKKFCSFKAKVGKEQTFCRNEYNITGHCNRQACPLANSRYATIREEGGKCFLLMKTVERAHSPRNLWEKIELPRNYAKALEIVTEQLQYHSKFQQHRTKQRLTKIHQYLIRMRKLRMKLKNKLKLVTVNKKVERREAKRERKALAAAKIEQTIQKELLDRLKSGTYGDIYNFPSMQFQGALEQAEADYEVEREAEQDEDAEVVAEEDGGAAHEYVEGDDDDDDDDDDDFGFGGGYDDEDADFSDEDGGVWDDSDDEDDDDDLEDEEDGGDGAGDSGGSEQGSGAGDEEPGVDMEDSVAGKHGGRAGRAPKRRITGKQPRAKAKKPRGAFVEVEYEHEDETEGFQRA